MFKKLFFILIVIASGAKQSFSQSWAMPGASWYYDFYNPFPTATGYIHIQKTGDSLVNSKMCDKLQVFTKWWSAMYSAYDSSSTFEFTYQDSNKVYYYSKFDSAFYILYDFNATPTNTWYVYSNCNPPNDMTDTINVDSTGITIINGDTLKHLWTSCSNQFGFQFWDKIVERIGGMGYMFPYPNCALDQPNPPSLLCYSDSTGWSYQADTTQSCNYIYTSINEPDFSNSLSLSPNPSSGMFNVKWLMANGNTSTINHQPSTIEIYSVYGEKVYAQAISDKGTANSSSPNGYSLIPVNLSAPSGIYFVRIKAGDAFYQKKIVKM